MRDSLYHLLSRYTLLVGTYALLMVSMPVYANDTEQNETSDADEAQSPTLHERHWSEEPVAMLGVTLIALGTMTAVTGAGLALEAEKTLGTARATADVKERAYANGKTYLGIMFGGVVLGLVGARVFAGGRLDE